MRKLIFGRKYSENFIAVFDTTKISTGSSANNQIKLPLVDNFPYTVKWGDGTVNTIMSISDPNIIHTYSSSGIYNIEILGEIKGFKFNNTGDMLKIIEILNWGNKFYSTIGCFYECSNLELTKTIGTPILIGSLDNFFRRCISITTINNLSNWDLKQVNSVNIMFYGCTGFNDIGISNWNTSKITRFKNLFSLCSSFNQQLNWDVSNVTNMDLMFEQCAINRDLSNLNFNKNVTLDNFMLRSYTNYNASYYDALLQKWASTFIGTGRTQTKKSIGMGTIKYTSAGKPFRDALVADGWVINDGGMI